MLDDLGHMTPTDVERELARSTSPCAGAPATTPSIRSFVNIIATPKGGTHVAGFERALVKTFNEALEGGQAAASQRGRRLSKDDVLEGLTAVVTVRLAEPQFEGQTKEVLGTPAASPDRRRGGRARA